MKTILIVDDNEQIRKILTSMIRLWAQSQPFDVKTVEHCNGAEALQWLKQHGQPYMILLDVRMPIMNGAEFLRQSALLEFDLRPYTLLLTGYADDLEEHLGTVALLMKHLRKPFIIKEVFKALDNLIAS